MPAAPATVEIIPQGWDELSKHFSDGREIILISLNNGLREMGRVLMPEVKKETPVGATGKLKNTTTFQIMGTAEDMRMEIRQSAFRGDYPYGVGVRLGTRPHFPPYRALIPWVTKKLGVDSERAPTVAFLIARKISKVGTKPNPYHVRAYKSKLGELERISADIMNKLADKLVAGGAS